jgi:hypothetical protein
MSLIELDVRDDYSRTSPAMDLQIDFSDAEQSAFGVNPLRISGDAGDLVDCDAVSTCPSDTDMVDLYDHECELESFVIGTSAIMKYLDPVVLLRDLEMSVASMGCNPIRIICPSFLVCVSSDPHAIPREFNFGYACVSFATIEEATSFSFLINSRGSLFLEDEDNCDESVDENEPDTCYDPFKLHVTLVSHFLSDYPTSCESDLRAYLSYYGEIVSLTWISGVDFEVTFSSRKSAQLVLDQQTSSLDIRFFVHPVEIKATNDATMVL